MLVSVSLATPMNWGLGILQRIFFRRRLAEGQLEGPPVFIIGHWRSGTTLLHELMVRDQRYSSPSTFQCFAPHHFLLSEWFFRKFAWWLLPGKRPMDNMQAGWDRPQEDEFALMNLGLPSPYRRIAFPNEESDDTKYLDFDGVSSDEIKHWVKGLRAFLVSVAVATRRPLVVKSPTHTGRIAALAAEFPDARFIHITRDPRSLFPSTCRLWRSLDEVQALQKPNGDAITDYVTECLQRMYHAFHRDRGQLAPNRMIDIRYEDLVADPVGNLEKIYTHLHLCDFETVRGSIEQWVQNEHQAYQPNKLELSDEQERFVKSQWQEYFDRYGYL